MLEETLGVEASNGADSAVTLKFSLAVESREAGDVAERQAADAVAKATGELGPLGFTPQAVVQLGSVVDTGTTIITGAQTFETTWGVLLERMAVFNKIVADVAAVFDVHRFASHRLNAT